VSLERNPRLQDQAVRVQLTVISKGPVVRAEAAAVEKMAALDMAVDKMAAQLRRAAAMTLGQALYEMELVGHDFFLFVDQDSNRPSVVYRRKGYDYGVIALDVVDGVG
jgi:hypothetical protein